MKKKWMKVLCGAMVGAMVVGSLAGCGTGASVDSNSNDTSEESITTIRIGYMPYYSAVPLKVIEDNNLDEKYGFEMELISFPSGGPMAEALGAGEWDMGQIGAGGMVAVPTYDAKLIADVEAEMDGIWIMANPDSEIVQAGNTLDEYPDLLGSTETLEGITMLGTIGNISQYVGLDYLEKFGLTMSDVNFLHMETAQVYTAFVSGNGDLACTGSPTAALQLLNEGYVAVGGLMQQGIPQQDAMLVSDEFYDNNKEDAVKFMAAWFEATEMLNSDEQYEFDTVKAFYTESGRTDFDDEAIELECGWNVYTDATNVNDKTTGQWMLDLVQFMVDAGTMEADTVDAMKANTTDDITIAALELMEANK